MKRKLSYRDKLIELAQIYGVREIQEYIKRRKNLTTGQLELILKKNNIVIPKDFKTSFFKENFSKPISRVSKRIDNLKDDSSKSISRFSRKVSYFKQDSFRSFSRGIFNLWKTIGNAGLGFLNVLPEVGKTIYSFIGSILTDLFSGIYDQKLKLNKVNQAVVGFFIAAGLITIVISGMKTYYDFNKSNKKIILESQKKKIEKKEVKEKVQKPKTDVKKEKKLEVKPKELVKKPEKKIDKSKEKKPEVILPDLNLETQTVLNLFKDVNYDLNKVRREKKVKPIYFTQFPRDLDELQSVKLKKETFIKIVLPLIVAENEKILEDREKLKAISSKRMTSDSEKQWLRQKLLEYKVKNGKVDELEKRMDIIPTSLALAQAAKESGWGTSRFALEGNAMFGQWTWTGNGIEPLFKDKSKTHKILKFPILRASVKSYINNLNTHKSYKKLREIRNELRDKNRRIEGLKLTATLDNYAETGKEYTKIIAQIIKENKLTDFEPVTLTKSKKVIEVNS